MRPRVLVVANNDDRLAWFRRRLRRATVTFVKTCADAKAALGTESPFEIVYLDHDLDGPGNGQDVAFAITRMARRRRPGNVVVHSTNPAGALGIVLTLRRAGVEVIEKPFGPRQRVTSPETV